MSRYIHSLGLREGRVIGIRERELVFVDTKTAFDAAVAQKPRVAVVVRRLVEPLDDEGEAKGSSEMSGDEAAFLSQLRANGKKEEVIQKKLSELRFWKRERDREAAAEQKRDAQQQLGRVVSPPCRVHLSGLSSGLEKYNNCSFIAERLEDNGSIVVLYIHGKVVKVPLQSCTLLPWVDVSCEAYLAKSRGVPFFVPDEFVTWCGQRWQALVQAWYALLSEAFRAAIKVWKDLMAGDRYGPVWTATRTSKSSAYLLSYIHNKNTN